MFLCNCRISPETFAKEAEVILGGNLVSVVLYGSAAAGDHAGKTSDYNVLIVLKDADVEALASLSRLNKTWAKAGNPPPLIFTESGFRGAADVFPIEILDILQSHRLLAGRDVVSSITVSKAHLRHQVEYELRSKLLKLRGAAVASGGCPKKLAEALLAVYSPLSATFRAALRLYEDAVPADKRAAVAALTRHIAFDRAPFERLAAAKTGDKLAKAESPALFAAVLKALETVTAAVDAIP